MTTPLTQRKLKDLVKRLRTFDSGYLDIPLVALDLLTEAEMALAAIAEAQAQAQAQAQAELRAYHALHDMLSEIIEDPETDPFAPGSEHRAALVEKLAGIPR